MNPTLPKTGRPRDEILHELESFGTGDPDYRAGRAWSLVYWRDSDYHEFLGEAWNRYSSANGLNPGAFKSLKRMERDVLRVASELFHGTDDFCGVMTSGGTESCLLAAKTYRDWGRAERGIRKPEMIIPESAHVAWDKGAEYFGLRIRRARLRDDWTVDPEHVRRLVNRNTVMILAGAPEYPHGSIDPVRELSEIAVNRGIPLHVDACVGGFILPFLEKAGVSLPDWDFRVPGVTSISADVHKYGFAAKGASLILYREMRHFRHQIFVQQDWPGGVFASPALLGTRPGGAYAAAWAAIQAHGEEGYVQNAERVRDATARLLAGIREIPGLEILGNPLASIFSYRSTDPAVGIFAVGDRMEARGWHIDRIQRPDALHAMVTPGHDKVVDAYLKDLAECVGEVRANPALAATGQAATYGLISKIPLRGLVRKQVLDMFAETYRLSGGEIDLTTAPGMDGAVGDGETGKKPGLVDRALAWYLSRK